MRLCYDFRRYISRFAWVILGLVGYMVYYHDSWMVSKATSGSKKFGLGYEYYENYPVTDEFRETLAMTTVSDWNDKGHLEINDLYEDAGNGGSGDILDILQEEEKEEEVVIKEIPRAYNKDLLKLVSPPNASPESTQFIFHNKLPKSGSSTMKHLLEVLQKENNFQMKHMRVKRIGIFDNMELVNQIKMIREKAAETPVLILKHHTFVNFTTYGYEKPTMINVVRHPVSQFLSAYYFSRYGWGLEKGKRQSFHGTHEDRMRSVDECYAGHHEECVQSVGIFNRYFCGVDDECIDPKYHVPVRNEITGETIMAKKIDWNKMAKATEKSKVHIARHYHTIGILEHFEESLKLFENTLPSIFKNAPEELNSHHVQKFIHLTKTKVPKGCSNETRIGMERILRYDMDIYNLCKSIFYSKLKFFGIPVEQIPI